MDRETRSLDKTIFEVRSAGEYTLGGYAAVFNSWTTINDRLEERILPGAFKKTIKKNDVLALWNHDDRYPLARQSAGTLRLLEDPQGLHAEIKLNPEIGYHRDLWNSIKDGTVRGMSFRFSVPDGGEQFERGGIGRAKRTLTEVDLYEVGPVTFPAYSQTSVSARTEQRVHELMHPELVLRARRLRLLARAFRIGQ